jgi:hypothetical protein
MHKLEPELKQLFAVLFFVMYSDFQILISRDEGGRLQLQTEHCVSSDPPRY